MIIEYLADGPDVMPMDNRYVFSELPHARRRKPCRTCGRGDVNVNVNVNTGADASVGTTEQAAASGHAAPRAAAQPDRAASAPLNEPVSRHDLRRIVADELQRAGAGRPQFETPVPRIVKKIEYRPFAVPQDRIVRKVEYHPFAVVWDRIKQSWKSRDVMHPVDRVIRVPVMAGKPSFEGHRSP